MIALLLAVCRMSCGGLSSSITEFASELVCVVVVSLSLDSTVTFLFFKDPSRGKGRTSTNFCSSRMHEKRPTVSSCIFIMGWCDTFGVVVVESL